MNKIDEIKSYVLLMQDHVLSGGNGVVVKNHILTAGHVIEENPDNVFSIGNVGKLSKENLIKWEFTKDTEDDNAYYDYALYKSPISSPLTLANEMPKVGDVLYSYSYKHCVKAPQRKKSPVIPWLNGGVEYLRFFRVKATVTEISGNGFKCQLSEPLEKGRSGSPLIRNGKVYGILSGGDESVEPKGICCVYTTSVSILQRIGPLASKLK